MKVVRYIGMEQRLKKIQKRDWRFEAARAMLNKSVQGLILLCHRYAFPYINELQGVGSLDKLWSTAQQYQPPPHYLRFQYLSSARGV